MCGGEQQPHCIIPIVKHGGGSVMMLGVFDYSRDLFHMKGKLNETGYYAIASETRLVAVGFVLMLDNFHKQASKLCQRCIKSKGEQHVL